NDAIIAFNMPPFVHATWPKPHNGRVGLSTHFAGLEGFVLCFLDCLCNHFITSILVFLLTPARGDQNQGSLATTSPLPSRFVSTTYCGTTKLSILLQTKYGLTLANMPRTHTKITFDVRLETLARVRRHAIASGCSAENYYQHCADTIMDMIE